VISININLRHPWLTMSLYRCVQKTSAASKRLVLIWPVSLTSQLPVSYASSVLLISAVDTKNLFLHRPWCRSSYLRCIHTASLASKRLY